MTDWNNFLRSDEFREYRRRQVEVVSKNIRNIVSRVTTKSDIDTSELRGKMEMVYVFLRLPESLTEDPKLKEILKAQLDDDVNNITRTLIRDRLNGSQ